MDYGCGNTSDSAYEYPVYAKSVAVRAGVSASSALGQTGGLARADGPLGGQQFIQAGRASGVAARHEVCEA